MLSYQNYSIFSPAVCSVWDKGYRYGFNSMEKDNEVSGDGNSYTTEYRQLDVRLGRWFSRDPIERAFESDYAGFSNNPIVKVDPDGDSDFYTANGEYLGSDGTDGTDIHIVTDQNVIDNIKSQRIQSSSDPTYYTYKASLEKGTFFTLPPYSDRQKIKEQMETQSPNQLNEIGGEGFLADNGSSFMAEAEPGSSVNGNDIIKYAESEIEGLGKRQLGMEVTVNNPTDNAKTLKKEWKQSAYAGGATTISKSYDWHSHPFHVVYAYYPKNGDKLLQYSLNKLPPNGEEVISKVTLGGEEGLPNSNPSQHDIDNSGEIAHYIMSKAAGTITRHKNGETTTTLKESVFYAKAKEKPKD
ncbi:MAG: hypothetical protein Q8K70_00105 [Bacteroidota bacterium]|nr:hypothetical protein [Bacteroidota bacterium]